jgi:hypothetical protein
LCKIYTVPLSRFERNADCELDGCGGKYTGWKCYAEVGADTSGVPAKVCPLLLNDVVDALPDLNRPLWSSVEKDCVFKSTENGCEEAGLSWDWDRSMCVAKCPPGSFTNPTNGLCLPTTGFAVCGRGTEWNNGACKVVDKYTNEENSTYCGEGTVYDEPINECVNPDAASASTISIASISLPMWSIIAIATLFVLFVVFLITGCCCRNEGGCCGRNGVGGSGDEGYRKYLPEAYANPDWRVSYASHA